MARVIYTGPLNPVIFARAKKEAEKAERIKGYTPRVIKTPAHTVVYSKTGPEVKAVVMDMIAPITFSIPGSAIPVAPSFLHLHTEFNAQNNGVRASGHLGSVPYAYGGVDITQPLTKFTTSTTGYATPLDAAKELWDVEDVDFPEEELATTIENSSSIYDQITQGGMSELEQKGTGNAFLKGYTQYSVSIVSWDEYSETYTYNDSYQYSLGDGGVNIGVGITDYSSRSVSKTISNAKSSTLVGGVFLLNDIRMTTGFGFESSVFESGYKQSTYLYSRDFYSLYAADSRNGTRESELREAISVGVDGVMVHADKAVISSTGSVLFPFDSRYVSYDGSRDLNSASNTYKAFSVSGVMENLDYGSLLYTVNIVDTELNGSTSIYHSADTTDSGSDVRLHVFVASSILGFSGAAINAQVYSKWPAGEKKTYGNDGPFVLSHLSYYFDIFRGKYMFDDAPHWLPPKITTDGICLPHAWFFCRGNETRQTDFYPNNHNRLSIVIYPQGRHEFSVDEAEIVSVELNHTPRFVAHPGGGIAFVMQSLFGGKKLVPYVVNGLVEERDEYGEPTGFYLAQDGAISGEFKAPANGGDPVVLFKLSPRQAFDGYRTVTVETATERKYGVQTTFEVQGSSGVRVQQPPSITLERINESVLAGQSTVFYVTATQIAVGSNLRYEVKRSGSVVSAGYIELGNCAGWVEFTAPFQSVSVPGDPVRYVLGDKSAPSTTPSTIEFEFSIIHEQAPPPVKFSVKFAHELYASSTDRPDASPMPPLFFLQPLVSENGEDGFMAANYQTTLINRIYYSLQSKRVYVLFWDGQSCDVSGILKQNQESGQYEYNPDWKEAPFDYPPAVDPYNIKGTLEPYVYAYMDYENNRNNGA